MPLKIIPINLKDANAFVKAHHRHHKPVIGYKFAVAISDESELHGVAIVGRPVARHFDDGLTLEVNRCCTDGVKNGCSMLYGAAWRVTRELGYKRLVTYTLQSESGASLRGAGWKVIAERKQRQWNMPGRPRDNQPETGDKLLWEIAI